MLFFIKDFITRMKNHCFCLFTSTIYSNRKRFPCLQLFAKPIVLETREELEEFETAVQTRDAGYEFEGLHITVKNSPNPSRVYIRLCKHRKKAFYCFYKIAFPRQNAKLFVMAKPIKDELVPLAKSRTRSRSCFAKRCFPKYGFLSLDI